MQGTVVLPRVSGLGWFCTPDVVCLSGMSCTLPSWCRAPAPRPAWKYRCTMLDALMSSGFGAGPTFS